MYRGNVPGQFNGSGMQSGQEYNPAYAMRPPGQVTIRGQMVQGSHSVQRFSNAEGQYGRAAMPMQYRGPQAGVFTNPADPYGYSQSKITAVGDAPQSFPGHGHTRLESGHMYASSVPSRTPGIVSDMPVVSGSNVALQQHHNAKSVTPGWSSKPPGDINMVQYGQSDPNAGGLYNGSQFVGTMPTVQPGSGQTEQSIHSRHSAPTQNSAYGGTEGSATQGASMQSYSQQLSAVHSQYQQNPAASMGMNTPATSPMYIQQNFSNQQRANYASPQSQLCRTSMQPVQGVVGQYDDSRMMMQQQQQQQNALQQQATMVQGYGAKRSSSSSSVPQQPGHQPQHLMGVPGHPLQQTMSPRHNSPLSPMRGSMSSRPSIPPASPQMQTTRTTSQYPASQPSPRLHQPGSMSPTSRLQSYSPKQQMGTNFMNQGQITSGYRPNIPLPRTPTPRNEQVTRGFMSPPPMLSSPPASQQPRTATHIQGPRMRTPPATYNGDVSQQHYYNSPGRFPHTSWQGARMQSTAAHNVSASLQRQPMPQQRMRYPVQQHALQQSKYAIPAYEQVTNVAVPGQTGFHQMLDTPRSIPNQPASMPSVNPGGTSFLSEQTDFDNDFNLDNLLSETMDTRGSFMQQLQDVVPGSTPNNINSVKPAPTMPNAPLSRVPVPSNNLENDMSNRLISPKPESILKSPPPVSTQTLPTGPNILPTQNVESLNSAESTNISLPPMQERAKVAGEPQSGETAIENVEKDLFNSLVGANSSTTAETPATAVSDQDSSFGTNSVEQTQSLPSSLPNQLSLALISPVTTGAVSETSTLVSPVKQAVTEPQNPSIGQPSVLPSQTSAVSSITDVSNQNTLVAAAAGQTPTTVSMVSTTPPFTTGGKNLASTGSAYQSNIIQSPMQVGHSGMVRPRISDVKPPYQIHTNRMGMPPRGSPGLEAMHSRDGAMIRGPSTPHYPPMHPGYQQHPRPYRYAPHPQTASGPYPAASAPPLHARPPYPRGPHRPIGPHGYMDQRPLYAQPMHPGQQQHLQQTLQGLKHEAQQLQAQLQQAQQEEANADSGLPPEQHSRSEMIRNRLIEVDRHIREIMSQLHPPHPVPQPMQDPSQPMNSIAVTPGYLPEVESAKPGEELMTPGGKKKRVRKPKTPKTPKGEGEGKKPPKKKKKKDSDGDAATSGGEKKKKKKVKKQVEKESQEGAEAVNSDLGEADMPLQANPEPDDGSTPPEETLQSETSIMEDGEIPMQIMQKAKKIGAGEKTKKKPPATVVKPKKKRKRGYDSSDEMNATDILQATPPDSPEDSLIEKRRSGRNVKRKRYVESLDLPFSGGEDDSDTAPVETKKSQQLVQMNDVAEDEEVVMVVDKILSHRVRRRRVRLKSESKDDQHKAPEDHHVDSEELKADATNGKPDATETGAADSGIAPNGAMLSPSSLKNPRIRRLSMGVTHVSDEQEELIGEGEDEFYLKYKNYSYLHCEWKTKNEVEDKRFDQKLKRYLLKNTSRDGKLLYLEVEDDELFNPDFVEVDRVLDVTHNDENGKAVRMFLTKWCSLAYEDSTWEREEDIDRAKIEEFEARCKYRPPRKMLRPHKDTWKRLDERNTVFCNNNVLRDYQFEGINWLLFNWYNKRNCILADEMGLGKTIQSITFLQKIFDHGIQGPFLIVAPLSTIANWQREFESWTTINAVVYHGSQTSRDMIHTYEWFCRDENLDEIEGMYKMHVVITTYEMVVLDSPHLRDVEWRCLIIDEAHRLKNLSCKLVESLRNMQLEHKVLLTGTPLQNNVEELFALLSFLQPDTFNCQQAFSLEFGNLKDNAQVEKLQELLKPMMLRRLKEDVEKSLAPKQETIIEVELTNIQKKYYRAILERNFEFLSKGASGGNVPNLMNTMMELRKCCNHPYLIKGAEDKITMEQRDLYNEFNPLQAMIQSSGKLVLIDKLLPRLKQGGHKVLIFSQMVRVLDILEDYLVQRSHLYERIDGCIRGNERQMAIDRFSRKGSDRFVFLLCTRAGGLGINLTAADTVIIFDSDWNPQNDLQAQARCHRIGQQKPVKVYRLITRNSYEREMFDKASLKLGLDKAVLQSISGRQDQVTNQTSQPQLSKREVEDLLKKGAYGAIMDDDEAANKFCEEDIDQILDRRAHTVTLEAGEKGSTFSKASFVSAEDRPDISLDDPNFWEKWAKKADLDLERLTDNKLILENPRSRKQTRRFGGNSDDQEIFAEIGSDSDDSAEYDSDGPEGQGRKAKFRSRAGGPGGGQRKGWGRRDCFRIEKCLLTFGWGRWTTIQQRGRFGGLVGIEELEQMARTVLMYCLKYYNGDEKIKFFLWDLITPAAIAEQSGVDLRNHEGLTAPVPRGRKGRRAKENPEKVADEQSRREWARDINLDTYLPDEGFRKHIQHQCNKILLRVRMLYYLRTEILNNITEVIDSGSKYDAINLDIVDKMTDPPASWWDEHCDKCLFIGIYKHGYEKYNLIRADPMLCFLERAGPPDERALAAEMDVEPDGDADGDPEYKPARITFTELEFGQDSPAPSTPNTEPASPATSEANGKKKEDDKDEGKESDTVVKKKVAGKDWPSVSELNARLRRLITSYQKHCKHMQQRLMNLERRSGRARYDANRIEIRRPIHQSRWTRREEADFYRTISTFGIERDPQTKNITWRRFRNIARLDRKTDESLRLYFLAFRNMCEQVCRWKGARGTSDGTGIGVNEEIPNIDVDPITEERASRTLYRIRLLDKIRCDVLNHPKLKERLALCQRSPELPIWWRCGIHDHELLVAMDRHGVTRTEIHTFNDPELSFSKSMREYESNPIEFRQRLLAEEKAELESMMLTMKTEQQAREAEAKKSDHLNDEEKEKSDTKTDEKDFSTTEVEEKVEDAEKKETNEEKPFTESADVDMNSDKQPLVETSEEDIKDQKSDIPEQEETSAVKEEEANLTQEVDAVKQEEEVKEESADLKSDLDKEEVDKMESEPVIEKEEESDQSKENDQTSKKTEPDDKEDEAEPEKSENTEKNEAAESDTKDKNEAIKNVEIEDKIKDDSKPASSVEDLSENTQTMTPQMSLRSKTTPTSLPDSPKPMTSNALVLNQLTPPYILQSMSGRWPKDRVLIQRVEHVCYCIINGEWPTTSQSLLQSISNSNMSQSGTYTPGRSQTSTPLSEGRGTPAFSPGTPLMPNTSTGVNVLNPSDKHLQAAMQQLIASNDSSRMQNYSSSRRGRRRKRAELLSPSVSSGVPFNNQSLNSLPPMDKNMQRKIEQLMAASNPSFLSSNTASLFSQSGQFDSRNSSSNIAPSKSSLMNPNQLDDEAGNSSASLLAKLRELPKSESKPEHSSSSRSRGKTSSYRRHHSPSPSHSKSKDMSKLSSDLLKAQQFMPTSEQLLAMNAPLQQAMQDALKAGIDPMAAAAAFMPFFPMLDPFQMMNASKAENIPQLPPQLPMPSLGDLEKILKSMGLPPELALMPGFFPSGMMPPTSQALKLDPKEPESHHEAVSKISNSSDAEASQSFLGEEKSIASIVSDKRNTQQRRVGSKLDAMFGGGKIGEDSIGRGSSLSSKKSRKSKFVSPTMLPSDTRIPVHNNTEGIRLSGDDAPLNRDLADWLKENSGFSVDYQALRQQLDDSGSKKQDLLTTDNMDNDSDQLTSPKLNQVKETRPKDILDEAAVLLKSAEKLVEHRQNDSEEGTSESGQTSEKLKRSDFVLPNPVPASSPMSSKAPSTTPTQSSALKQQQLMERAMLQQLNAASLNDPTAALLSLPPEILANLAQLPPDVATILASGLLPGGGASPDLLSAHKLTKVTEDKRSSESLSPLRSSTSSRASPAQKRPDKNPPSDPSLLTGEERVTVVNITTGKKFTGRSAPELQTLADYLRLYPDVVVSPDWSSVIRKSKFLPKELHTRLLPTRPSTPSKSLSTSAHAMSPSASTNAAAFATAALGGLPPGAAAMFPGLLQSPGAMADQMQLMAALQQMPGQSQADLKALAAAGLPMLPFLGLPNPFLTGAFPGQDPATMAAMAALSQGHTSSKKDQPSSSHERSSESSRSRKSRKHEDRGNRDGSRSFKQSSQATSSFSGADPMAEALAALQRSGGFPGMGNAFAMGPGANPMLFPPMMMPGQNSFPMDMMMNPELFAAQMAAFSGLPNFDPAKLSSVGQSKQEKRRGSSSSSSASHKPNTSNRSQSRGANDEQPMDLTQFAGGNVNKDRETPDKH